VSLVGPCPACGTTALPGFGHACIPKPPVPGVDYPATFATFSPKPRPCGCTSPCKCAVQPRRTVCADCRSCSPGLPGWYEATCNHENARDLVTGLPTSCRARNTGHCPDFEAKP